MEKLVFFQGLLQMLAQDFPQSDIFGILSGDCGNKVTFVTSQFIRSNIFWGISFPWLKIKRGLILGQFLYICWYKQNRLAMAMFVQKKEKDSRRFFKGTSYIWMQNWKEFFKQIPTKKSYMELHKFTFHMFTQANNVSTTFSL